MTKFFIPHSHSQYSNIGTILDCINKPKDLILKAHELGANGIALTDHGTITGWLAWLKAEKELKESGLIPKDFCCALGIEIYISEYGDKAGHFILIAKDNIGKDMILKLSSLAWIASPYRSSRRLKPINTFRELNEIIAEYGKGHLVASTACLGSATASYWRQELEETKIFNTEKSFDEHLNQMLSFFDEDFYLEIAPSRDEEQLKYNQYLIQKGKEFNIPVIFGTDAHYLRPEQSKLHRAFINANRSGDTDGTGKDFYKYSHLMTNQEIIDLTSDYITNEEFQAYRANSFEIIAKIQPISLGKSISIPRWEVTNFEKKDELKEYPALNKYLQSDFDQDRYWINTCLNKISEKNLGKEYLDRIEIEADIMQYIEENAHYSLTTYHNFLNRIFDKIWELGSPVGVARGSAPSFVSNYLLNINQVDGLKENFPYWRYLNKDRFDPADIDFDIAPTKRKEILSYLRSVKGEYHVLQCSTFRTASSKDAIKIAARGMGLEVDEANYLSGIVPVNRGQNTPLSTLVYGNEEEGIAPSLHFKNNFDSYPQILEAALSIEGTYTGRGTHASGVFIIDDDIWNLDNAIMRSPDGTLTTQFDLHQSEEIGLIKIDMLATDVQDILRTFILLMQHDNLIDPKLTLRQAYNKYLHPDIIDYSREDIWNALETNAILNIFQFVGSVGTEAARVIKPQNQYEMSAANAIMRLMVDRGEERPMNRYARLKTNPEDWDLEMIEFGLSQEEQEIVKRHMEYGCMPYQESMMTALLDEDIWGWTLEKTNNARKIIAKKHFKQLPKLREEIKKTSKKPLLAEYIYEKGIKSNEGYAFNNAHTFSYSIIGIQTIICGLMSQLHWNCANLIVRSGAVELLEKDVEYLEEEHKDSLVAKHKMATALGECKNDGIIIKPPSINTSNITFTPDMNNNEIRFGLKGISRINNGHIVGILENRPFVSIQDFIEKTKDYKFNIISILNLIKSGAFDEFGDRKELFTQVLLNRADTKTKLSLQNVNMLYVNQVLPMTYELKIWVMNKNLKNEISEDKKWLYLRQYADIEIDGEIDNHKEVFENEVVVNYNWFQKEYEKAKNYLREDIKKHHDEYLIELNQKLLKNEIDKYMIGNEQQWEIDSLLTYITGHELDVCNREEYQISNFFTLSQNPEVKIYYTPKNEPQRKVPIYYIYKIWGTVVAKDLLKKQICLSTPTGAVMVKFYGESWNHYNKQISEINLETGKKEIKEKGWLQLGTKLIIQGIRNGDEFIAKRYKNTPGHLVTKIDKINSDGSLILTEDRSLMNKKEIKANWEDD